MPTKSTLQDTLKAKYGINKNITQSLSAVECEELLTLLQGQPSAMKLVESFIAKNEELSQNNRNFGQQRSQAQKKLKSLQVEHEKLEKDIATLEKSNTSLVTHRDQLSQEQEKLEAQIKQLSDQKKILSGKVQSLTTHNDELHQSRTFSGMGYREVQQSNSIRRNKLPKTEVEVIDYSQTSRFSAKNRQSRNKYR
ncbi:hypothetical protein [Coleofasciculus sp.]|uniref:hypothetical protein n=1 Tax=Coleofasciculus sp. TaxID=3100458 RepID=UPI0039F8CC7F